MILELYALLTFISFLLIILGFVFKELPLTILGFAFLFIINADTLVNDISVKSGVEINSTHEMNVYAEYNMHLISFFLCVLGTFGTFFSFKEYKTNKKNKEEVYNEN